MLASESCRERIAVYTSEGRANLSELKKAWPTVDFSLITSEQDPMFADKEEDSAVAARALQFINWVMALPERRIAVVTHSVFLQVRHPRDKGDLLVPESNADAFTKHKSTNIDAFGGALQILYKNYLETLPATFFAERQVLSLLLSLLALLLQKYKY